MALVILRGSDQAPLTPLRDRTVAVLGYGNQGRAHALNLRDSGIHVIIGARAGRGFNKAETDGFPVDTVERAAAQGDLVIVALPDEAQPDVCAASVLPHLRPAATLGFIHGFTVRYGLLQAPAGGIGVVMVAPKGPGVTLRDSFVGGQGIPCLLAVERESGNHDARALALAWANGIGCARAGVILTNFRDETETDLFGEQAVLCGGVTALIHAAFESLVEAGYPPELAYLECCHELKQVTDLIHARGIAGMMAAISNTAEFGALAAKPLIADEHLRGHFRSLLRDVRDGAFARAFRDDYNRGFEWFASRRRELADHPIEQAGEAVRSLMPWLKDQRA